MPKFSQVALLAIALGASSLAMAQTTTPQPGQPGKMSPPSSVPPEKMTPPSVAPGSGALTEPQWHNPQAGELRASKLIGTTVKNAAGESIGDINEVVLGKDAKVAAVVVGVGGFLGLGEREVAVRYDSLRLVRDTDQRVTAILNVTKDSLKAAPAWKWSTDDRGSQTGTGTKPSQ
jgi:sporulation protein YlmC with PRC-barrel domain